MRLYSLRLKPETPGEVSNRLHRLRPVERSQVDLRRVDARVIHQREEGFDGRRIAPSGKLRALPGKPAHERTRPLIGDIIEVRTAKGLGYVQYTHEHREPPTYGSLLRALPGLFARPPDDWEALARQQELFWVFCPISAALRQKGSPFRITANVPIPDEKAGFPVFRYRAHTDAAWWMWDGEREWMPKPDERGTPRALEGVWNDTLLIERIEEQWSPPDEEGWTQAVH
jgi:hypothetical protein